ncbi:MAG TPA: hypothetical protein VII63_00695 [Caulobacteraceae bacterium]
MRRIGLVLLVAALAVAFDTSAASLLSYGWKLSDATVVLGPITFRIYVHPTENTLLIQPAMKNVGQAASHLPLAKWRQVAEAFVSPIGCGISDVRSVTKMGATWEAAYLCPPGVDLRALVKAQRVELQRGAALHR